ncbi:MAG: hypothetical protein AAGJ35_14120, partial [Myxococcota bacterium]
MSDLQKDYQHIHNVGSHMFGDWFRAEQKSTGLSVLIKGFGGLAEVDFAPHFEQAVRSWESTSTMSEVELIAHGFSADTGHYLVMPGNFQTLEELVQQHRGCALARVSEMVKSCCATMRTLHQEGGLWLSFSPSCLLVDPAHFPAKLLRVGLEPFAGLSRSAWQEHVQGVEEGLRIELAPELLHGDPEKWGPSADIYGLSSLVFHLLMGISIKTSAQQSLSLH